MNALADDNHMLMGVKQEDHVKYDQVSHYATGKMSKMTYTWITHSRAITLATYHCSR